MQIWLVLCVRKLVAGIDTKNLIFAHETLLYGQHYY